MAYLNRAGFCRQPQVVCLGEVEGRLWVEATWKRILSSTARLKYKLTACIKVTLRENGSL